jgi:hypothetical protein
MKQPNEGVGRRKTYEEVLQSFMTLLEPDSPPPPPKPAAVIAKERWSDKPTEAVVQDATAHNETLVDHLQEAKRRDELRALHQGVIDRCWQSTLDAQAALHDYVGCHRGSRDSDWGL